MSKSTGRPMRRARVPEEEPKKIKRRQAPGRTIDSRENQMIRLAMDLVEKRMRMGTATSQEVVHFLKLGSTQAQLEKAKLDKENTLLAAKTDSLQSSKIVEKLYTDAIRAFRTYSGQEEIVEDET